jgi:hypothetical protein
MIDCTMSHQPTDWGFALKTSFRHTYNPAYAAGHIPHSVQSTLDRRITAALIVDGM